MTSRRNLILILTLIIASCAVMACGCTTSAPENTAADTHTITDMAGRDVAFPADVSNVLTTSPPSSMLVYMIAPDKLMAWNFRPTETNLMYMPERYADLPVVGGWFGTQTGNYENFISMHPDIVLEGFNIQGDVSNTIEERQQKLGTIPVAGIENTVNSTGYEKSIRFAGEVLGEKKQAEDLIRYYNDVLDTVRNKVAEIPDEKRVTVYYAEGPEGLMTDPAGSHHSELIELCGGINAADCKMTPGNGRTEVSIEQVMDWNPDVILSGDPRFYQSVYDNPVWQDIKAVQDKRVYLVPTTAFCWFDRPPGVNRIIGIPWTAKTLYPEEFDSLDLRSLIKEFHIKFFHQEIKDNQMDQILNP